jgi:hypothetical protein
LATDIGHGAGEEPVAVGPEAGLSAGGSLVPGSGQRQGSSSGGQALAHTQHTRTRLQTLNDHASVLYVPRTRRKG